MKKLTIALLVLSSLLSGCVVYDVPYGERGGPQGRHRDHDRDRDRDGDGVPNRQDRRPDDPRRY